VNMNIEAIEIFRAEVPLRVPYKVSKWTFTAFDPLIASIRTRDGHIGWGEATITAGYAIDETPATGWSFLKAWCERLAGCDVATAKTMLEPEIHANSHAASILISALEMIEQSRMLMIGTPAVVPLLVPVNTMDAESVGAEVEGYIAEGFQTLKVKVGFDVDADLKRISAIQRVLGGRAMIRLDANQAYSVDQGRRFAAALDPTGIQLFEQPCDKADWTANAAVAGVSTVPVMLDESIYGIAEIERAAKIKGVGFVKVKLKKMGSLVHLEAALQRIAHLGLTAVLGDGTATDISCWMEAGVARTTISNAGENNGFLKLTAPLFKEPLPFSRGAIRLPAGWWPQVDEPYLRKVSAETSRFTSSSSVRAG
jgi:L-alanine-DL-glutamate epimerase-like enolase superfamily enzyme